MIAAITALATLLGFGVLISAVGALAWYIYTRRPTPERSLREAVGEIRWGYGIAIFVIPQGIVGLQEGLGPWGFILGACFLGSMLLVSWWTGI